MGANFKMNEEKLTKGMIIGGIIIIGILTVSLIIFLLNVNNSDIGEKALKQEKQVSRIQDTTDDSKDVSTDIGKTVNEAMNELNSNVIKEENKNISSNSVINNTTNNTSSNTNKSNTVTKNETSNISNVSNDTNETEEVEEDIKFTAPIKGEIIREFAIDSLVYSETLEEWITHNGIDIKADKTSVVKAVATGTVYAIKNDPRYGLTVIVNHNGGYQSIYANLLTAEYVVEGEEIEAGQTIGTVGNSATFEISDDYHLHFELMKQGEYVNPNTYMEF